jgi:hypothetical protein
MYRPILVLILSITLAFTVNAKTYKVNTANDLRAAFKTVNPGDSISSQQGRLQQQWWSRIRNQSKWQRHSPDPHVQHFIADHAHERKYNI